MRPSNLPRGARLVGVNSESAIHNQNVQPLGAVARAESATSLRAAKALAERVNGS